MILKSHDIHNLKKCRENCLICKKFCTNLNDKNIFNQCYIDFYN